MPHDSSVLGAAGRMVLCAAFATVPRLYFQIETHGLEHDARQPRTFYAIMHKRDADGMAPLPPILIHRGWRGLTSDIHFAMRSDAFERGFLARLVLHPHWFSFLLRPIDLGPLLRGIGAHPLRDLRLRPAETWIREALRAEGDQPAGALLTPSYLAELATAVRQKPETFAHLALSKLLRWRYHIALQSYYGAEIFVSSARRRAERRVLDTAKAYLDDIAAWLRRGGSIFNGPEGRLTPDGRLSPITGGMYRVLRASPPDTSVLPIALVYDFMTTGRPRLFVDVTAPIENAPTCSRQELFATLRQSWLLAARFTCTQLASGVITAYGRLPDPVFSTPRLVDEVRAQAHKLAGEGRHVDKRLLDARGAARLVARYLEFARRRGIVRREDRDRWRVPPTRPLEVPPGGVGYPASPLAYAANELSEMLSV